MERVCKNDPRRHKTGTSEEGINPQRGSVKTCRKSQTRIGTPKGNSVGTSRRIIQEINPGNTVGGNPQLTVGTKLNCPRLRREVSFNRVVPG